MKDTTTLTTTEGELTFDKKDWFQLRLDTPIYPPRSQVGRTWQVD